MSNDQEFRTNSWINDYESGDMDLHDDDDDDDGMNEDNNTITVNIYPMDSDHVIEDSDDEEDDEGDGS